MINGDLSMLDEIQVQSRPTPALIPERSSSPTEEVSPSDPLVGPRPSLGSPKSQFQQMFPVVATLMETMRAEMREEQRKLNKEMTVSLRTETGLREDPAPKESSPDPEADQQSTQEHLSEDGPRRL